MDVRPLHIEPLARVHQVEAFSCGVPALDRFLVSHALQAQQANASRTYVGVHQSAIVGFYTLVVGEVRHIDAPDRVVKGMPRHPIPLMVLARLAVHRDRQGRGIGASLLRDALLRTLQAADIAGIRAVAVHAKDEAAVRFYKHYGFAPSATDPCHLFLLVKDIRQALND
jgi:GNAT superfamily N-acetyltransferase